MFQLKRSKPRRKPKHVIFSDVIRLVGDSGDLTEYAAVETAGSRSAEEATGKSDFHMTLHSCPKVKHVHKM